MEMLLSLHSHHDNIKKCFNFKPLVKISTQQSYKLLCKLCEAFIILLPAGMTLTRRKFNIKIINVNGFGC